MNKNYITAFLLLFVMIFISGDIFSQDDKKENEKAAQLKAMIDSQTFTFEAQTASPMRGGLKYLDPGYTLKVRPDTLRSDLPYFGRAYQADYGSSDGGLKATSLKFDISVKELKKGGWDITMKTKDLSDQLQFILTIFEDGTASLNVNSSNRQPISFRGFIVMKK